MYLLYEKKQEIKIIQKMSVGSLSQLLCRRLKLRVPELAKVEPMA